MNCLRKSALPLSALGLCCALGAWSPASAASLAASRAGLAVSVDPSTGAYTVTASKQHWTFSGTIGSPLAHLAVAKGHDKLGEYQEVSFQWKDAAPWFGAIRDYNSRPLVSFAVTSPKASKTPTPDFPAFATFPQGLHTLSYRDTFFSPHHFGLSENSTPWLLFDDSAQTAILSPASDFLVSKMRGDGKTVLASGLNPDLSGLPAGFTHTTFLVVGQGIGRTERAWGDDLTGLSGKPRDTGASDPIVKYFGYWTDNGATYYYNYDMDKGYAGTLLALRQHYKQEKIPIHYMQLDSWWYQKSLRSYNGTLGKTKNSKLPEGSWNRYGGTLDYTASPDLFPKGLPAFQKDLGLPLAVHGRWLDPTGPYAKEYKLSGVAAIDPRWWNDRMAYLKQSDVICYEQDWLNEIYSHSPAMGSTLDAGAAFTDNMARAAKADGLTLQYCMASPRFFLQGSRYNNLTTIRVSNDRFDRSKWNSFLYTSLLADSLHVRPWTDVFNSTELGNITLATLSSGPVGVGDAIGKESRSNIMMTSRADGVIVKPDAPITPTDATILADARGEHRPLIAATYTGNGLHTGYVFACTRKGDSSDVAFVPASLGFTGQVYVWNPADKSAKLINATDSFTDTLGPIGWATYVVAPVGRSGIAFLGDADKFVGTGRERVPSERDEPGRLIATVALASGDGPITLQGYASSAPSVAAKGGSATPVSYDAATGHFSTVVAASANARSQKVAGEPVNLVTVTFSAKE